MTSDLDDPLALHYEYSQLSITDLLTARDLYHFHLMDKTNVVGTAIGYYLIRPGEHPDEPGSVPAARGRSKSPRTLSDSVVRDYSWPCVIVLVSQWEQAEQFGGAGKYDPTQMVPRTLYMPDGQAVPVCVVEARQAPVPDPLAAPPDPPPAWPLGGGLPITVTSQGEDYLATAGGLVTDGHYTYALTAAHVCGDDGTKVSSRLRGGDVTVGRSSTKQLTRMPFSEVYPDFPGRRTYSALDAGLVRLADMTQWTSNIYGLPPLGPMEDVHEHNLSLRLIDRQVLGYGAASGLLRGTIKALFYRYRSVGGFDYVADFLISPGTDAGTRHGDSGMIWCLDLTHDPETGSPVPLSARTLRPLAMEWGGQAFVEGDTRSGFAVAASMSTVCRLLDVELVSDLSRGVSGYWGRVGHYGIAAFAAQLVSNPALKTFLQKNIGLLSFDLDAIAGGKTLEATIAELGKGDKFMPLGDVPDEIWKKLPPPHHNGRTGGRDDRVSPHGSNGPEHPNHYADIDDPGTDGTTWRAQCLADDANITAAAWLQFYSDTADRCATNGEDELAAQYRDPLRQGLLPLRVWQIFDAMIGFLQTQDTVGFLTAAGVLAHYVGDASQPLHGSILADGDPRQLADRTDPHTGKPVKFGEGVHIQYESAMVTRKAADLIALITQKLPGAGNLPLVTTGQAAARAALQVMDDVARILSPRTILESFEQHGATARVATLDAMWDDLGDATVEVMLTGAKALAMIWDSAWERGNGGDIGEELLGALDEDAVRARYVDASFVPSRTLAQIAPLLT